MLFYSENLRRANLLRSSANSDLMLMEGLSLEMKRASDIFLRLVLGSISRMVPLRETGLEE